MQMKLINKQHSNIDVKIYAEQEKRTKLETQ